MAASSEVTILLVDDDELDIELAQRAFRKARLGNPIVVAENGEVALEILRAEGDDRVVRRPYVVLLDLNMPRMNGIEFLEHLRSDERLSDSIVFVLTTSDADRDRWAAYEKHVAGYILKSNVGEGFVKLISMLEHYWRVVELPIDRRPT